MFSLCFSRNRSTETSAKTIIKWQEEYIFELVQQVSSLQRELKQAKRQTSYSNCGGGNYFGGYQKEQHHQTKWLMFGADGESETENQGEPYELESSSGSDSIDSEDLVNHMNTINYAQSEEAEEAEEGSESIQ